jgi:hypothetical protein
MAEDVKKIAGSRFIPQGLAPAEVDRYKQDLLAEVSRGVSRILADGRLYLVRYHWDDARDSVGSTSARVIRLEAHLALQMERPTTTAPAPPG